MKIVCKIKGGLGNQLFQLSFGLKFSFINNLPIIFDASSYTKDKFGRKLLLQTLDPNLKFITPNYSEQLKMKRNLIINEKNLILENKKIDNLKIEKNSLEKIDYIILDGYWNDSRVIDEKISKYIRSILFNYFYSKNSNQLFDIVKNSKCAIAMHLRRVDYAHHGIVDENIYLDLANNLLIQNPESDFFIFSDEPNYVKYIFSKEKIPFTIINTGSEISDLALMSLCEIFVISNSTYSFWGAFLSNYKYVLYPDPWSYVHSKSEYLIPKDWIKLPNTVKGFMRRKFFYNFELPKLI